MYRLIIAGIGVLAVALLAAGCGGGGSDEATAQVSKAEFFKQARTICAKTQKELQAEIAVSGNEAQASSSKIYGKAAQLLEQEVEELEALSGSEQVEKKVEPLIENVSKASRLIAQNGQDALTDPSIIAYKKEARALHLEDC
ncbi:MAG: hypothetical protein ACTHN3_11135 [Solirubrobacterales bacterium]